jgi:CubicO group peptidase (beta-lactamase class C family)
MSAAIDANVGNFMNQYGIPGATVTLTYNNQLIFAKSYGYADVDNVLLAQPDSRFRIASISKAITAMGILKLVHDSPATTPALLSYYPFQSPAFGPAIDGTLQAWLAPATVDALLHHAGGFHEDYEDYDTLTTFEKLPGQNASAPPACATLMRYVEARPMTSSDQPPGTSNFYSNVGFCALSEVIHNQSGSASYFDYVQTNVLNPLGMNDTQLGSTQQSQQRDREGVYYPCGFSPLKGPADGGSVAAGLRDCHSFLPTVPFRRRTEEAKPHFRWSLPRARAGWSRLRSIWRGSRVRLPAGSCRISPRGRPFPVGRGCSTPIPPQCPLMKPMRTAAHISGWAGTAFRLVP